MLTLNVHSLFTTSSTHGDMGYTMGITCLQLLHIGTYLYNRKPTLPRKNRSNILPPVFISLSVYFFLHKVLGEIISWDIKRKINYYFIFKTVS